MMIIIQKLIALFTRCDGILSCSSYRIFAIRFHIFRTYTNSQINDCWELFWRDQSKVFKTWDQIEIKESFLIAFLLVIAKIWPFLRQLKEHKLYVLLLLLIHDRNIAGKLFEMTIKFQSNTIYGVWSVSSRTTCVNFHSIHYIVFSLHHAQNTKRTTQQNH